MKNLFWILALFALAVGISLAININEGYVLLVLPPHRTEISLNLLLIILLLGFSALYALLRTAALTLSLPQRVREFRTRRMNEKMRNAFSEGVRLLFEGQFSHAIKKSAEAHESDTLGHFRALSSLLAARAAQQLGDAEQQKGWLDRAAQEDQKMQSACLMLEAEMQAEVNNFDKAIELLARLQTPSGMPATALHLELQVQQKAGRWMEVLRVVRQLEKQAALPADHAYQIKCQAHEANILQQRSSLTGLQDYLKSIPTDERAPMLDCRIAEALLGLGANVEASEFIQNCLRKAWNSRLAGLYGLVKGGDGVARIAQADAWLQQHRDDPHLLLALGRMCLEQRQWGKAQAHLDAALSVADTAQDQRQIQLDLARFCEATERCEDAVAHYRLAVSLSDGMLDKANGGAA